MLLAGRRNDEIPLQTHRKCSRFDRLEIGIDWSSRTGGTWVISPAGAQRARPLHVGLIRPGNMSDQNGRAAPGLTWGLRRYGSR